MSDEKRRQDKDGRDSQETRGGNQAESLRRKMDVDDGAFLRIDDSHSRHQERPTEEDVHESVAKFVSPPSTSEHDGQTDQKDRTRQVVDYDFRQPTPVHRDCLTLLTKLLAPIGDRFAAKANETLKSEIDCELIDVQQKNYSDFVYVLEQPACFYVLNVSPLSEPWFISVSPRLAFALIDRMLGGDPSPTQDLSRPITDIESRLLRRVLQRFCGGLQQAWQSVAQLEIAVQNEMDPHPVHQRYLPNNDRVVNAIYACTLRGVRGEVNLCMSVDSIAHLLPQLSDCALNSCDTEPTAETRQQVTNQLATASIDVVVNLARSTIRTQDLLGLSVGDIIATEKETTQPLELCIQDVPKFEARAGSHRGRKAVQIESILEKPESRTHSSQRLDSELPDRQPKDS